MRPPVVNGDSRPSNKIRALKVRLGALTLMQQIASGVACTKHLSSFSGHGARERDDQH